MLSESFHYFLLGLISTTAFTGLYCSPPSATSARMLRLRTAILTKVWSSGHRLLPGQAEVKEALAQAGFPASVTKLVLNRFLVSRFQDARARTRGGWVPRQAVSSCAEVVADCLPRSTPRRCLCSDCIRRPSKRLSVQTCLSIDSLFGDLARLVLKCAHYAQSAGPYDFPARSSPWEADLGCLNIFLCCSYTSIVIIVVGYITVRNITSYVFLLPILAVSVPSKGQSAADT